MLIQVLAYDPDYFDSNTIVLVDTDVAAKSAYSLPTSLALVPVPGDTYTEPYHTMNVPNSFFVNEAPFVSEYYSASSELQVMVFTPAMIDSDQAFSVDAEAGGRPLVFTYRDISGTYDLGETDRLAVPDTLTLTTGLAEMSMPITQAQDVTFNVQHESSGRSSPSIVLWTQPTLEASLDVSAYPDLALL